MCTREELKSLLFELILRVDQVALLSAKYQFNDEFHGNANDVRSNEPIKIPLDMYMRERFDDILRFQRAYIRYFVFADDPLMNFIVPLPPSSLTLFITNILSDIGENDSPSGFHTTHSIIRFLQFTNISMVHKLFIFYRNDLLRVVKEMRLPYSIEVLTKIRQECYHKCHAQAKNQGVSSTISSQQFHRMNQYPAQAERFVVEMVPVIQSNKVSELNPMTLADSTVAVSHLEYQSQTQDIRVFKTEPRNESLDIPPEVVEMALDNMKRLDTKMTMDLGKTEPINSVSGSSTNPSHQLCAGCGKTIQDRYLLKALDMLWHEDCLKCGCCECRLGEVGSTLYTKGNLMLCKRDYLRLFGNTGMCAACNKVIPAFEMVMRARNNVYHLECFACQQCNHRFCVGDRFFLCENKILCEYDYEERLVFASIGNHPMMKRHASEAAQQPAGSYASNRLIHSTNVAQNPPPPYTKTAGNMSNGTGVPIDNNVNGISSLQQQQQQQQQQHQAMGMNHSPQQHIPESKLQQHDDLNNNNNNNSHGPTNAGNCGMNQFNSQMMKIPHSA